MQKVTNIVKKVTNIVQTVTNIMQIYMLQQKQVPRFLGTKTIKQKVPILGT